MLSLDVNDPVVALLGDLGLMTIESKASLNADNPAWTAPEALKSNNFTKKSDVYSFAIVLYELVTRTFPFSEFECRFFYQQMDIICEGLRPNLPPGIPPALASLIVSCWDHQPNNRLSFDEIVEELDALERQGGCFLSFPCQPRLP